MHRWNFSIEFSGSFVLALELLMLKLLTKSNFWSKIVERLERKSCYLIFIRFSRDVVGRNLFFLGYETKILKYLLLYSKWVCNIRCLTKNDTTQHSPVQNYVLVNGKHKVELIIYLLFSSKYVVRNNQDKK